MGAVLVGRETCRRPGEMSFEFAGLVSGEHMRWFVKTRFPSWAHGIIRPRGIRLPQKGAYFEQPPMSQFQATVGRSAGNPQCAATVFGKGPLHGVLNW